MTHNLLSGNWTAPGIAEVLDRHPRRPLLPPLGAEQWSRAARNSTLRNWQAAIRTKAEKECSERFPVLTVELYASFRQTGIRLTFEQVYFDRRRRLARAAISLLLSSENDPWRPRLVESITGKLTSIFEEVSWALPAHVNWHNDDVSGKEPLQIDLMCAATANLMAEMLDLFGAILPVDLQTGIRNRLNRDIFENYLEHPFHWKDVTHNWNAVCHQGVIGAALSQVEDARLLSRLLDSAQRYLPLFLSGFGNDGGCLEGPSYWDFGFGWFAMLNEQLELRTGGELSLFEGDAHVLEIARYGPRMSLPGGNLVNFSDSNATGGLMPYLFSYLGQRLNDPEIAACAHEAYALCARTEPELDVDRRELFSLARLFLRCPENSSPAAPTEPKDCFFPDLGVLVAHGTDHGGHCWDFAAKGGHNDEHHNHNDCGSYILNIDGVRLIAEIGAPEYVHDFFQPDTRYGFLAARTLGHSLPVINGCEQAVGAAHAARILRHSVGGEQVEFVVDATLCYPGEAGCRKFLRTFRFDKHLGKLTVEDLFELDRTDMLESAVMTFQSLVLEGNQAVMKAGNLNLILRAITGTRLDRVETHSYHARDGKGTVIQRLVLTPDALTSRFQIGFETFLAD